MFNVLQDALQMPLLGGDVDALLPLGNSEVAPDDEAAEATRDEREGQCDAEDLAGEAAGAADQGTAFRAIAPSMYIYMLACITIGL